MVKIRIRALKPADRKGVEALFRDAGWWDESYGNGDFIPRIIRRSTVFLGAFAGERLVGRFPTASVTRTSRMWRC
jgi:hypothetical protein